MFGADFGEETSSVGMTFGADSMWRCRGCIQGVGTTERFIRHDADIGWYQLLQGCREYPLSVLSLVLQKASLPYLALGLN